MINTFKKELKKWKFLYFYEQYSRVSAGFSFQKDESGSMKETLFLLTALPVSLSLLLDGPTEGVGEPGVLPILLLCLSEFLLRGFLCFS